MTPHPEALCCAGLCPTDSPPQAAENLLHLPKDPTECLSTPNTAQEQLVLSL